MRVLYPSEPAQCERNVPGTDEKIGFLEGRVRACYPVLSKRVGRVHNGMLSRATFLMNGVSRHTGSFNIPRVTTRGEM
jgi:hypothetical protein